MTAGQNEERRQAPNREELLQLAISAAKQNNLDAARMMFQRVLGEDRKNERAMMWMAKLADSKAERVAWLERVLEVNPNNELARDTLKRLSYRRDAANNRVLLVLGVVAAILVVLGAIVILALSSGG